MLNTIKNPQIATTSEAAFGTHQTCPVTRSTSSQFDAAGLPVSGLGYVVVDQRPRIAPMARKGSPPRGELR